MARLQGQDVKISLFLDGEILKTVMPNDFKAEPIMEVNRVDRLGSRTSRPETSGIRGYTGTMTFDIESPALDDLEQYFIDTHLGGGRTPVVDITEIRSYSDGSVRRYLYPMCVVKPNTEHKDAKSASTKSFSWDSETRVDLDK